MLGFIMGLPVVTALMSSQVNVNSMLSEDRAEYLADFARYVLVVCQVTTSCIVIVGGVLAAFVLFRYLHSRRQVDFYHSLPLRREKLFFANVLAGLLIFLVPYLIGTVLNVLMAGISGVLPYMDMNLYVMEIALNILVYMLIFACAVLAVMLSGTLPSAFKVLAVTFGICPAVSALFEGLAACFYETHVDYVSPLSNALLRASVIGRYAMISWGDMSIDVRDWLVGIVLLVVLLAGSLLLYKKRQSECAGSTMAFAWQKLLYKYPVVLLGGIGSALFFYLVGSYSRLWLFFGAVVGTAFFSLVMEIFIHSDFRAVRKGLLSAAFSIVIVGVITSVYAFDVTNYDVYVPAAGDIEEVCIFTYTMQDLSGGQIAVFHSDDEYWHFSIDDYIYRNNYITCSSEAAVGAVLNIVNSSMQPESDRNYNTEQVRIIYKLKNGSYVARNYYRAPIAENIDNYATILEDSDWQARNAILNTDDYSNFELSELTNFALNNSYYYGLENISQAECAELLKTYARELRAMDAKALLTESPVMELSFYDKSSQTESGYYRRTYYSRSYYDCYIYENMTDTLALLQGYCGDAFFKSYAEEALRIAIFEYTLSPNQDDDDIVVAESAEPTIESVQSTTPLTEQSVAWDSWNYGRKFDLTAQYYSTLQPDKVEEILANSLREEVYRRIPTFSVQNADKYYEVTYYLPNVSGGYDNYDQYESGEYSVTELRYPQN
jgi:ABC-2 type transport system permease protein